MADGITIAIGGTALTALGGIAGAWIRARHDSRRIEPQPLEVRESPRYVTREEFERHAADDARDHENIFARLARSDREAGEIKGILSGMRDDLSAIKGKLFGTRR